jgi:hypothetical protein
MSSGMRKPSVIALAGLSLLTGLSPLSCSAPDSPYPDVVCAGSGWASFSVKLEPALGAGSYVLTLDSELGSSTCATTVADGSSRAENCSGDLDIYFDDERFGIIVDAPARVTARLEHIETGTVLVWEFLPEYVETNPEYADVCPTPMAPGVTVEPAGMPTREAQQ